MEKQKAKSCRFIRLKIKFVNKNKKEVNKRNIHKAKNKAKKKNKNKKIYVFDELKPKRKKTMKIWQHCEAPVASRMGLGPDLRAICLGWHS